ncbi:unnamed protein product [Acanthosepion pharaonis]|uniref:Uncharacterized protein n=1 Tax=Acanthosepion pharaonis TaxID=158019 RepID=A0A812EMT8_ACAPH|nr:unnamed protein product [Sepia pharaonis]
MIGTFAQTAPRNRQSLDQGTLLLQEQQPLRGIDQQHSSNLLIRALLNNFLQTDNLLIEPCSTTAPQSRQSLDQEPSDHQQQLLEEPNQSCLTAQGNNLTVLINSSSEARQCQLSTTAPQTKSLDQGPCSTTSSGRADNSSSDQQILSDLDQQQLLKADNLPGETSLDQQPGSQDLAPTTAHSNRQSPVRDLQQQLLRAKLIS